MPRNRHDVGFLTMLNEQWGSQLLSNEIVLLHSEKKKL